MNEQDTSGRNPQAVFDFHTDGIGEYPGPSPLEEIQWNERVNRPQDLPIQVGRFGKLRRKIESYTSRGLSLGVQYAGPRRVRMLIAENPDLIKKTAAVGAIGTVVAVGAVAARVIYMHEHRKPKK